MRFVALVAVLIAPTLITINCFSQSDTFEKGYVVTLNNDTITGYIERTREADLSEGIVFKQNLSETAEHFHPDNLHSFYFENDKLSFQQVLYPYTDNGKEVNRKRFGKLMLSGTASLYKIRLMPIEMATIIDNRYEFIYLLKKGSEFLKLNVIEIQDQNIYKKIERYKNVLTYAMQDCPSLPSKISTVKFSDQSMLELTIAYNKCVQPEQKIEEHTYKVKPIIRHGPWAAYSLLFSNDVSDDISMYSMGYFADIRKPDLSQKLSLGIGLNYTVLSAKNFENFETDYLIGLPITLIVQSSLKKNNTFLVLGYGTLFHKETGMHGQMIVGLGSNLNRIRLAINMQKFPSVPGFMTFSVGYSLTSNKPKE